ncbi:MAG: phosphoribosylglycinamide formyltransferase [Pelosinus sp.]|nr:phosphoribosylglycinamide formyltransferase [Pelosinus sp.]
MSKITVLGVLASGRGSNLQSILDAISAGRLNAKVGVVISDNPEANVLKRLAVTDPEIPAICIARRAYESQAAFEADIAAQLKVHHVELVILAGFMRILSPSFVHSLPGRVMNIHPSLLPSFPGKHVHEQALSYGVKVSGCTVHFIDEGTDTGPIILQEAVPVLEGDTPETLAERILHTEHILYPRAIELYCQGRLKIEGRRVIILEKEDDLCED